MSELLTNTTDKRTALKRLIKSLHEGSDPERAKKASAELLRTLTATEIAQIEEQLIEEGMPRDEIERLCEVHLAVFQEALEREQPQPRADHPIQILMAEHRMILDLAAELEATAAEMSGAADRAVTGRAMDRLRTIVEDFRASGNHYLREENVLFPFLEKHGVVEPPIIMWREHDKIRSLKKELYEIADGVEGTDGKEAGQRLQEVAGELAALLESHFYKENNILFPAAQELLTEQEWAAAARQFGEIGYWKVAPSMLRGAAETPKETASISGATGGQIPFGVGALPLEALEPLLNSLPVDLTFVDAQDSVRYFSQTKERIFPRAAAIIGRKVQQCHPEKSVHLVNQILEDFRNNRRDSAVFWIQSGGRFIVIGYYAVRRDGRYLGCVEVTQDVTGIRALEGEKRLL